MLSVGRCGVVRLQMKFGHMDGIHCIIDGTCILVKIKSVALYNCRTVYFALSLKTFRSIFESILMLLSVCSSLTQSKLSNVMIDNYISVT